MQSSSEQPLVGEERYVTNRITAAKETTLPPAFFSSELYNEGLRNTKLDRLKNISLERFKVQITNSY